MDSGRKELAQMALTDGTIMRESEIECLLRDAEVHSFSISFFRLESIGRATIDKRRAWFLHEIVLRRASLPA